MKNVNVKNLFYVSLISLVVLSSCGIGQQNNASDSKMDEFKSMSENTNNQNIKSNPNESNNVTSVTNTAETGSLTISLGVTDVDDATDSIIKNKVQELNNCLKNTDTKPCESLIATDMGSISGTQKVRDVLVQFPPYMNALKEIKLNKAKTTQANLGEKVYVVTGDAVLTDGNKDFKMYVRYNFVEQNNELKCYGIRFSPNKLDDEF